MAARRAIRSNAASRRAAGSEGLGSVMLRRNRSWRDGAAVAVEPFACNRLNVKHEHSTNPSACRRHTRVAARPDGAGAGPSGAAVIGARRRVLRRLRLVAGRHRRRAGPASQRTCPRHAGLRRLAGASIGGVVGRVPPDCIATRPSLGRHRRPGSNNRREAVASTAPRPGPCATRQRAAACGLVGPGRCCRAMTLGNKLRP